METSMAMLVSFCTNVSRFHCRNRGSSHNRAPGAGCSQARSPWTGSASPTAVRIMLEGV